MKRRHVAAACCGLLSLRLGHAQSVEEPPYSELIVLRPRAGEVTASVTSVQVALDPVLRVHSDHRLRVLLNGRLLPDVWVTDEFRLRDLPRGAHRLQVLVMAPGGQVLVRSEEVRFRVGPQRRAEGDAGRS